MLIAVPRAAGVPFAWVTADEAYGDNRPLRAFLEEQQVSYVLVVSRDHVIIRSTARPSELAFYLCHTPARCRSHSLSR